MDSEGRNCDYDDSKKKIKCILDSLTPDNAIDSFREVKLHTKREVRLSRGFITL